jgi:aspartyl/asparaginyl-tRNA synthetase
MSTQDLSELEQLRAEVKRLQLANEAMKPTLATRTGLKDLFDNAADQVGRVVGVAGWVRTARVQGRGGAFAFIKLYDGTTPYELQIVLDSKLDNFQAATKGSTGASLFVVGLIKTSRGREQSIEMEAHSVEILGLSPPQGNPLAKSAMPLEYLRQVAHFRPRTQTMAAAARIRNRLAFAVHEFFQNQGYFYINTPMITAADCEGAGEMFQVTTLLKDGKLTANMYEKKLRDEEIAKANQKKTTTDSKEADAAPAPTEAATTVSDEELKQTADYSQDFFNGEAFLTVSGQLNGETYATALSKIYTFGPTFRAENSHTTRHLSEFWMIEPEIAFADLKENMDIAEAFIKFTINRCLSQCDGDMAILEAFEQKQIKVRKDAAEAEAKAAKAAKKKREREASKKRKAERKAFEAENKRRAEAGEELLPEPVATPKPAPSKNPEEKKAPRRKPKNQESPDAWRALPLRERLLNIVNSKFARCTYTAAIELCQKAVEDGKVEFEEAVEWGMDMGSEHERYLCERHFKRPTIVTDYPKSFKAFYMRANPDGKTVAAMDILVPGVGELIGGSQREERMPELLAMMAEKNLDPKHFSWYLDLRRFGSVPHSGFGLGFERLVNYTTGLDNIRDAIPFPRFPGHCTF